MSGHRQAFLSGIIHRDISEGNVMLSDDIMSFFMGFLLDFDYGFDWKEVLKRAGRVVNEANWKQYVEEYNRSLPQRDRPAPPELEIPFIGPTTEDRSTSEHLDALRMEWLARMKMKERTVRTINLASPML